MANVSVTYSELLTEVDAAITAIRKVAGVDPHVHLKPLVRELQRVRGRYASRGGPTGARQGGIYVPNGTRRRLGLD